MKKIAEISVKRGYLAVDVDGYVDWYSRKPRFNGQFGEWMPDKGEITTVAEVDVISKEQSHASLTRISRACKISLVIEE